MMPKLGMGLPNSFSQQPPRNLRLTFSGVARMTWGLGIAARRFATGLGRLGL